MHCVRGRALGIQTGVRRTDDVLFLPTAVISHNHHDRDDDDDRGKGAFLFNIYVNHGKISQRNNGTMTLWKEFDVHLIVGTVVAVDVAPFCFVSFPPCLCFVAKRTTPNLVVGGTWTDYCTCMPRWALGHHPQAIPRDPTVPKNGFRKLVQDFQDSTLWSLCESGRSIPILVALTFVLVFDPQCSPSN